MPGGGRQRHRLRRLYAVDEQRGVGAVDGDALQCPFHGWKYDGSGQCVEQPGEDEAFARDIDPDSLQVSLAAPYPGTYLYRQALENGWLDGVNSELVDTHGVQIAPLHYPHLSHTEIFDAVETFYKRFYFRSGKIATIVGEMVRSPEMMKRRLREGIEFFHFLRARRENAH